MYNAEQKENYIRSKHITQSTITFFEQIFKWFEPYETQWNCDLTLQDSAHLSEVINSISGLRKKSGVLIHSILKDYADWSKQNGYNISNGIYDVIISNKDKIKNQMVASPAGLNDLITKHQIQKDGKIYTIGFDSPEKETVDITYRVFFWMAFAGLKDVDAIRVKAIDVRLNKRSILFDGDIYPIYEEGLRDFEKACKLTSFVMEHPHYTAFVPRASGNIIMRGFRSDTPDLQTIRPVINKRMCIAGSKERVSYNRIYLSGIFYRTYFLEAMGAPVNFMPIVSHNMQNKTYTTTKSRTTIANQYSQELYEDYIEWKEAFYPKNNSVRGD